MLASTWPRLRVDEREAPLCPDALDDEGLGGVVAVTDRLDAGTLRLLEHLLPARTALPALLVVGARGLAGFERLIGAPHVAVLPEPVTPAALQRLEDAATAPAGGADAGARTESRLAAIEERLGRLLRVEETMRSQQIDLAHLRQDRARQDEERVRTEMLRSFLRHRDRLADLQRDVAGGPHGEAVDAVLRTLDEDLAGLGVVADPHPDAGDAAATTVIASRPRTATDPRTRSIVRRPAFFRVADGERRILRPAEIELLE